MTQEIYEIVSPSQRIHEICNRMDQRMSAARINLARADLRMVADRVKELEIANMELRRERDTAGIYCDRDTVIAFAMGGAPPQQPGEVVHLDRFRTVPIRESAP